MKITNKKTHAILSQPKYAVYYNTYTRILDVKAKDKNGTSLLMIAAALGKERFFKALLKNGANIYDMDRDGSDVLSYAVEHGKNNIIKIIHEHQANAPKTPAFDVAKFLRENKEKYKNK